MRFMMIIKSDAASEAGVLPDEKLLAAMGAYNDALAAAGLLRGGEGLQDSSKGFRIHNQGGELTVVDGPFAETKELMAGFWLIEAKSKEEVVEWAKKCPCDEGQIEIRPIMNDCDPNAEAPASEACAPQQMNCPSAAAAAGVATVKPTGRRYMMMFKSDERIEAGAPPDPKVMAEMGALCGEMMEKGVMLSGDGLHPSSKGVRVYFEKGKRRVVDGPFAEAKELVCGYCIARTATREEALEWAKRGILVHGDGVSEVRPLFEMEDFGPSLTPELQASEERLRMEVAAKV